MKTLVIGLGNPILTDDGVGVKVAHLIDELIKKYPLLNVDVTEASVGGLRLMETLLDYDNVYLIDAILSHNGTEPGTFQRMTLKDLTDISPTQHSASAHDTTLVTALEMAKRLGLPVPPKITIYAISVENVLDFNEQPTKKVAQCIPHVANAVLDELLKDYQLSN